MGRPSAERQAAEEFVLDYLSEEPTAWKTVQLAAEARSVASEATLNLVRADLAKSGQIVQIGKGKQAKWIRGNPEPEE